MQEKNIIANTYWANNERFADVMNVGMDVTKKAAFGTNFIILTTENQSDIHYAMPVRVMGYEFLDYNRQLKEIKAVHDKKKDLHGAEYLSGFSKGDKLRAVCTLVIYYGKDPWTGPTRLSEMLDLSELPEAVRNMVADYPIHIIDARRFKDSEKLETDARLFFGMIQRDDNADEWAKYVEENREAFQNISTDTYDAIATYTRTGKFLDNKHKYMSEEGDVDMCKAMDDLIKRGEESGKMKIIKLIQCMAADGLSNLIPKIAEETDFCEKLFAKYDIG